MPDGVHPITVDRNDREAFAAAIEKTGMHFDLAIDCVGYLEDDAKQDVAVFRHCCDHFVFISTDFVFDPLKRVFPTPSDHAIFESVRPYGRIKRLCELQFIESDTGDMAWTIVRPCHIYGPGSPLGCLPMHSRDLKLIDRMRRGEPIRMVGGGHFLQQPIYVDDMARICLSCLGNSASNNGIYQTAGPDIIESHEYYRIIADVLGVEVTIQEVSVQSHSAENPADIPFFCHRIYDLSPLRDSGLYVPDTSITEGLRKHTLSLAT